MLMIIFYLEDIPLSSSRKGSTSRKIMCSFWRTAPTNYPFFCRQTIFSWVLGLIHSPKDRSLILFRLPWLIWRLPALPLQLIFSNWSWLYCRNFHLESIPWGCQYLPWSCWQWFDALICMVQQVHFLHSFPSSSLRNFSWADCTLTLDHRSSVSTNHTFSCLPSTRREVWYTRDSGIQDNPYDSLLVFIPNL